MGLGVGVVVGYFEEAGYGGYGVLSCRSVAAKRLCQPCRENVLVGELIAAAGMR